ncbi:MAG: tetratricopeptide (TPR) repeat protein [Planctomycetota bacterium]|jgi:tetratricopeptide (TPR) repeat protein
MRYVGSALTIAFLIPLACNTTSDGGSETQLSTNEPTASNGGGSGSSGSSSMGASSAEMQDDWDLLTVEQQKKVVLVEQYCESARDLMARGYADDAALEVARASELDPDNLEVRKLSDQVAAILGDSSREPGALAHEMEQRYELRVQELRSGAEEYLRRGNLLAGRGDYEAAVAEFSLCLDHIRWAPYSLDWGTLQEDAEAQLASAKMNRDKSAEDRRAEAEQIALRDLREQEMADVARRDARVAQILKGGFKSFHAESYEAAQKAALEALTIDPRNEHAIDLRDNAFRAGRENFRADTLKRKRDQYTIWEEQMDELLIPYTDLITFPSAQDWEHTSRIRADRTNLVAGSDGGGTAALRQQLMDTRIPGLLIDEEESLQVVVDTLHTLTGLPLVTDPAAEDAAEGEGAVFNFALTNPLPLINVLDLVADYAGPEVTWMIKHDAVILTTNEKARGEIVVHSHPIQDLNFVLADFLGPRINELRLLENLEDDDGGGPFGGLGESTKIYDKDALEDLIRNYVAKASWETDGVDIRPAEGNLIVAQTPEVHLQISQFLEDLRLFSSSMVTIESKFMSIEDNWLQEIGVEFRGIDNPTSPFTDLDDITNGLEDNASLGFDNGGTGVVNNSAGAPSAGFFFDDGQDGQFKGHTSNLYDNALGNMLSSVGGLTAQWSILDDAQVSMILRMIEKSSQVELINDQLLSVQNTQHANVTVINQRAYIQDFEVEVAQFEAIANPQINVLQDGIVLDVRPTIHHDRKYLTLELQPTVAKVVALRPFSTGLGSNTSPVEFSLPELQVQSIFTTVVIPDGGTILIGGLSRIRQIERRSEVPWLANIPIIGILFKNEGYNDERSSLMIMVRAWITDIRQQVNR